MKTVDIITAQLEHQDANSCAQVLCTCTQDPDLYYVSGKLNVQMIAEAIDSAFAARARRIVDEVIEGLQDRNEGFGPVIDTALDFQPTEEVRAEVAADLEVLMQVMD
jgi:hypothetical protein